MKANYVLVKTKSREKADCSVLAAASALALSYEEAYGLLKMAGRKANCAVPGSIFKKLGLVDRWDFHGESVGKAMERMQDGRFVVFIARHFFAVVDGRMFNNQFTNFRSRVKYIMEVPLDNPVVLSQYPYLQKIVALDKLPDIRGINERRLSGAFVEGASLYV